ncbi:Cna B-type domain-containing protein [Clostridiales bacterium COT073_COT-073]|nr:Cna B-type domain-containing protein [Clostridiales bacterium COT073_COT-073]
MSGEKIKLKSILAKLMVLIMTINLLQGMVALPVTAEASETTHVKNQGSVMGTDNNEGITIEKSASDYKNGQFKVKLQVEGSEVATPTLGKLDVILLIDRSGSMKGQRITNAKDAAKKFVDKLLVDGQTNVRVGVVSFASAHNGAQAVTVNHDLSINKKNLKKEIDKIQAVGGTYVDMGFEKVEQLFANANNPTAKKLMVLIADGEPTFAYDRSEVNVSNDTPQPNHELWHKENALFWRKGFNQANNSYQVNLTHKSNHIGTGNSNGDIGRVVRNSIMTADFVKAKDIEIISVGIGMTQTIEEYFMKSVSSNGEYLNANQTASNLQQILDKLHGTLIEGRVRDGVITDPIADQINFSGNIKDIKIEVKNTQNGQNISHNIEKRWEAATRTITLNKINLKKNERLIVTYPATLKEEWMDNNWHDANKETTLKPTPGSAPTDIMKFKVPKVKDFKSVEIVVNKTWTVAPPAHLSSIDFYIKKQVGSGNFETLPEPIKVTKASGWKGSKADLPLYQSGCKVTYKVEEAALTGYEPIYTEPQGVVNGQLIFGVQNKNVEMQKVKIKKNWLGEPAASLTVDLYQVNYQGTETKLTSATITKQNFAGTTWEYTFGQAVRKYDDNGKPYTYKVKEIDLDGNYLAVALEVVAISMDGETALVSEFTNRNTSKTQIWVEKQWKNTPASLQTPVTVELWRKVEGGQEQNTGQTLPLQPGKKKSFNNLPVYDIEGNAATGKPFIYSVKENGVDLGKYNVEITGAGTETNPFVITNTNKETTEVKVTKAWLGEGSTATIELYKGGTKINQAQVTDSHTFTTDEDGDPLPKYENGQEVVYTVKEMAMPDYNNGQAVTPSGSLGQGFTFTNVNTKKDVNVTVTKKWVGKVGTSISLTITGDQLVNGQYLTETKEVMGSGSTWTYTFTGLRRFGDNGIEIKYTVSEAPLANYETTVDDSGLVFTNTYSNKETTSVTVKKLWKGNVGTKAKVQLLANGKTGIELVENGQFQSPAPQIVDLVTPDWKHTFANLRKEDQDGQLIVYTVKEIEVDAGYTAADPVETGTNNFSITNSNQEKVKVTVNKTWRGTAKKVIFELLENGDFKGREKTLEVGQNSVEFTDLPKYKDEEVTTATAPIVYTIRERGQNGNNVTLEGIIYQVVIGQPEYDNDGNVAFAVTNISQEKVSIRIQKEWVRKTGTSIEVELIEKGTNKVIATKTIKETDKEWNDQPFSVVFEVLKYDQTDGHELQFDVRETKINGQPIADYTYQVVPVGTLGKCFKVINTNTESTSLAVGKDWVGGASKQPEEITITLTATVGNDPANVIDVVLAGWANAPDKVKTLKKSENWQSVVYANLPKYYNNQVVTYSVKETPVPGFATQVNVSANGVMLVNTYQVITADIEATKIWFGGTAEQHKEVVLTLQYRVKGSNDAWADFAGQATAVKKDDNTWKYTWKDVPQTDNNGNAYEYQAIEKDVPNHYEVTQQGLTVTNTSIEKTSYKVIKTWLGDAKAVEVTLTGTVGTVKVYEKTETISATPDSNGLYQFEFTDLPKYDTKRLDDSDPTGKEILYSLTEKPGIGFEQVGAIVYNGNTNAFMITNRNTENMDITITKEWKNTPQTFIKGATLTLQLYRQVAGAEPETFGDPFTLEYQDLIGHQLNKSVPKFNQQGKPYTYTVKEVAINGQTPATLGYQVAENGLTIVNTNQETIIITVNKKWDGPRKPVTFELYKGQVSGQPLQTKELAITEDSVSFDKVPKYENGELVQYWVKEQGLEGYQVNAPQKVEADNPVLTITNTNTEKVQVRVVKKWVNAPQAHQQEVKAELYVSNDGGQTIVKANPEQSITLVAGTSHTFEAPKYDAAGNPLVYYVFETKVGTTELDATNQFDNEDSYQLKGEDYQLKITRDPSNNGDATVILTNTNVQTTEVKVKKQWNGPLAKAKITLWKGQEEVAVTEIEGNNSFTFTKDKNGKPLPKRENGQEITYTVSEAVIPGYNGDAEVNPQHQSDGSYLFVNNYTKTRDITVEKIWKPAYTEVKQVEITLTGKVNGDTVVEKTAVLKADPLPDKDWKHTFTGLPEYHGADEIVYTVTEKAIENYPNPDIVDDSNNQNANDPNAFTITNTYKNDDTVDVKVTKIWKGYKTDAVTIVLLRDGVETSATIELNDNNRWTNDFKGLKKNNPNTAKPYIYDVKELDIAGFDSKKTGSMENGFTFTNTVEPTIPGHKITLEVEKVFIGQEQDSVKVQILADGRPLTETLTVTKNAEGKWIGSKELPKYDASVIVTNTDMGQIKPIVYTIKELDDTDRAFDSGNITLGGHSYTLKIENPETNKFKITNISQAKTTILITKKWVRKIGTKAEFDLLLGNGNVYTSLTLENQNGDTWTGQFEVPTFDAQSGERIAYQEVVETKIDDVEVANSAYTSERTGDLAGGYTFTNTNKELKGDGRITITKSWEGGHSQVPESITVKLVALGSAGKLDLTEVLKESEYIGETTLTLKKADGWTLIVDGLPKYFNNEEVTYSVEEIDVPANFTARVDQAGAGEKEIIIINTFTSPKTELPVRKDWSNTPDAEKKTVTVQLYAKTATTDEVPVVGKTLELAAPNWNGTFTDLDEFNAAGESYRYSVKETLIGGQAVDANQYEVGYADVLGTAVVTNTNVEKMTIKVVKKWLGDDASPNGASFKLYGNNAVTELSLAQNESEGTFVGDFSKYKNGELVEYSLVEEAIEGYKQFGEIMKEVNGNIITFTVTNCRVKDIPVEKTWVGAAANSVSFGLYHGDEKIKTLTLTIDNAEEGIWKGKFTDVFVYDKNGEVINHQVKELDENGNAVETENVDQPKVILDGITYLVEQNQVEEVFKFTNTALNEIEVEKVWKGQIATGAGVTLALYDVADPEENTTPIQTIELPINDSWSGKFENLPTHTPAGDKISYSVKEAKKNADGTYQMIQPNTMFDLDGIKYKVIESTDNGKFIFTNVQYLDITMKKVWDDKFPAILRENVKLVLYSFEDGTTDFTRLEEFILNEANGWTQTKTDLPRWANNKYISYRVVEENINGEATLMPWEYQDIFLYKVFEIKIDPKDITGTAEVTVINGVTEVEQPDDPDYQNLRVVKFWGTTAEEHQKEVEVELYVKDEQGNLVPTGQTLTLNKGNNWVAIFENLPKFWADKASADKLSTEMELKDEEVPAGAPKAEETEKPEETVDGDKEPTTETGNDSEPISEENTEGTEDSSTTTEESAASEEAATLEETTENPETNETAEGSNTEEATETENQNGGSADLTETEETPKAEEGQAEEAPKAEDDQAEETPKAEDGQAEEEPKTEDGQAEEAPKAEDGQTEEAPKADEGQAEEAPKAEDDQAEETPKAEEGQTGEAPKAEDGQNEETPQTQDGQDMTIEDETLPLGEPVAKRKIEYFVFETKIGDQSIPSTPEEGLTDYQIGEYQVKIVAQENTVYIKNLHASAIPDSEKININVTKDWTDVNQIRIKDVEITLYVLEGDTLKQVVKEPLVLGEANDFKGVFANLRKKNDAGEELKYYVFETKIGNEGLAFEPAVDLTEYDHGDYRITIINNGSTNVTVKNFYRETPPEPWNPGGGDDDDDDNDDQDKPKPKDPTPDQPKPPVVPDETIPDADVPEGNPTEIPTKEETITEEEIPQGKTELPKTDGVASSLFHLLGGGLAALGLGLKRKKK